MARRLEEGSVEFGCTGECSAIDPDNAPTWMVEGRFNAGGEFEPVDTDELDCSECHERGDPTDDEIRVADL